MEKKIAEAKEAYESLQQEMIRAGYSKDDAVAIACLLIRAAVDADEYASEEEYQLFSEVTGIEADRHEFFGLAKMGSEKGFVKTVDEMVDAFKRPAKQAALKLVKAFIDVDGVRTESEQALLDLLAAPAKRE